MTTIVRDPALQKLMDELAALSREELAEKVKDGDPSLGEVWIAFCEGRHLIPMNQSTPIDFGEWKGPPMPANEILIHGEYKGHRGQGHWSETDSRIINTGDRLVGNVTFTVKE